MCLGDKNQKSKLCQVGIVRYLQKPMGQNQCSMSNPNPRFYRESELVGKLYIFFLFTIHTMGPRACPVTQREGARAMAER